MDIELIGIITNLDILVSADSGPMHIGFAVCTPTLGLFSSIPPEYRMPLKNAEEHRYIFAEHPGMQLNPGVKERKSSKLKSLDIFDTEQIYKEITTFLTLR